MNDIYSRWGVEIASAEKMQKLKNRLYILLGAKKLETTKAEAQFFAFQLGESFDDVAYARDYSSLCYIPIEELLSKTKSPFELANLIEALIHNVGYVSERARLLASVINKSGCGVKLQETEGGWQSYPAGEDLLDQNLVDKPLSFLSGTALEEYRQALEHYAAHKWVECAEKTRRALEEYLRQRFSNSKGLQQNIQELGSRLKAVEDQVPEHLRNTLTAILAILDKHYNESSKHNTKTYNDAEAEFLIYQTGMMMRMMESLPFSLSHKGEG